jgi:hypothetical protein
MGQVCEGFDKDNDNGRGGVCDDAPYDGGGGICTMDVNGDFCCDTSAVRQDTCQSAGGVSCCPASAAPSDLCKCECSGDPSDCPGYDPGPWWMWWLHLLLDPGVVKFLCIVVALAACCVVKCFVDDRRHRQRLKRIQQDHGSLLGRQQLQFEHPHVVYGTMTARLHEHPQPPRLCSGQMTKKPDVLASTRSV